MIPLHPHCEVAQYLRFHLSTDYSVKLLLCCLISVCHIILLSVYITAGDNAGRNNSMSYSYEGLSAVTEIPLD